MNHNGMTKELEIDTLTQAEIQLTLQRIESNLEREIKCKQTTIERQEEEIKKLNLALEEKNSLTSELNGKLAECVRVNEGHRQLINKLINDIERLNQDLDWYKRTYETRSLLGTLKEKILGRKKII